MGRTRSPLSPYRLSHQKMSITRPLSIGAPTRTTTSRTSTAAISFLSISITSFPDSADTNAEHRAEPRLRLLERDDRNGCVSRHDLDAGEPNAPEHTP